MGNKGAKVNPSSYRKNHKIVTDPKIKDKANKSNPIVNAITSVPKVVNSVVNTVKSTDKASGSQSTSTSPSSSVPFSLPSFNPSSNLNGFNIKDFQGDTNGTAGVSNPFSFRHNYNYSRSRQHLTGGPHGTLSAGNEEKRKNIELSLNKNQPGFDERGVSILKFNPTSGLYRDASTGEVFSTYDAVRKEYNDFEVTGEHSDLYNKYYELICDVLSGKYSLGYNEKELNKWRYDNFVYVDRYVDGVIKPVPILKPNASLPPIKFASKDVKTFNKENEKWLKKYAVQTGTDTDGTPIYMVKAGAPAQPEAPGEHSQEEFEDAWKYYLAYTQLENKDADELVNKQRYTAGWDKGTTDTFSDAVSNYFASYKGNQIDNSAATIGFVKDVGHVLKQYFFNPLIKGDAGIAMSNALVNFNDTVDIIDKGYRAVQSGEVVVKYSRDKMFDNQKTWVYSGSYGTTINDSSTLKFAEQYKGVPLNEVPEKDRMKLARYRSTLKTQKLLMELGGEVLLDSDRHEEFERAQVWERIKKYDSEHGTRLGIEMSKMLKEWRSAKKFDKPFQRLKEAYTTHEMYTYEANTGGSVTDFLLESTGYMVNSPSLIASLGTSGAAKAVSTAAVRSALESTYKDIGKTLIKDGSAFVSKSVPVKTNFGHINLDVMKPVDVTYDFSNKLAKNFDMEVRAVGRDIYNLDASKINMHAEQAAERLISDGVITSEQKEKYIKYFKAGLDELRSSKTMTLINAMHYAERISNGIDSALLKAGVIVPYATIKSASTIKKLLRKNEYVASHILKLRYKTQQSADALYRKISSIDGSTSILDYTDFVKNLEEVDPTIKNTNEFKSDAFRKYKEGITSQISRLSNAVETFKASKNKMSFAERLDILNRTVASIAASRSGSELNITTFKEFEACVENMRVENSKLDISSIYTSAMNELFDRFENVMQRARREIDLANEEGFIDFKNKIDNASNDSELSYLYQEYITNKETAGYSDSYQYIFKHRYIELHPGTKDTTTFFEELAYWSEKEAKSTTCLDVEQLNIPIEQRAIPNFMPDLSSAVRHSIDIKLNIISKGKDSKISKLLHFIDDNHNYSIAELDKYVREACVSWDLKHPFVYKKTLSDVTRVIDSDLLIVESIGRERQLDVLHSGGFSLSKLPNDEQIRRFAQDYEYSYEGFVKTHQLEDIMSQKGPEKETARAYFEKKNYKEIKQIVDERRKNLVEYLKEKDMFDDYKIIKRAMDDYEKENSVRIALQDLHNELSKYTVIQDRRGSVYQLQINRAKAFELLTSDRRLATFLDDLENAESAFGNVVVNKDEFFRRIAESDPGTFKSLRHVKNCIDNLSIQSQSFRAGLNFLESVRMIPDLPKDMFYMIMDNVFGISARNPKNYFLSTSKDISTFIDKLSVSADSWFGNTRLALDKFRANVLDFDYIDREIFKGKFYNDLVNEIAEYGSNGPIQNRLREFCSGGHSNPEKDVNVQVLQLLLRDPDSLAKLNVEGSKKPIVFFDLETHGLNKDIDAISQISCKRWVVKSNGMIDDNSSLIDILNYIENDMESFNYSTKLSKDELSTIRGDKLKVHFSNDKSIDLTDDTALFNKYCEEFEAKDFSDILTEDDLLTSLFAYLDNCYLKSDNNLPVLVSHSSNRFDAEFLSKRCDKNSITPAILQDYNKLIHYGKDTFTYLKRKCERHQIFLEDHQRVALSEAFVKFANDLPDFKHDLKFLDFKNLLDSYRILRSILDGNTFKQEIRKLDCNNEALRHTYRIRDRVLTETDWKMPELIEHNRRDIAQYFGSINVKKPTVYDRPLVNDEWSDTFKLYNEAFPGGFQRRNKARIDVEHTKEWLDSYNRNLDSGNLGKGKDEFKPITRYIQNRMRNTSELDVKKALISKIREQYYSGLEYSYSDMLDDMENYFIEAYPTYTDSSAPLISKSTPRNVIGSFSKYLSEIKSIKGRLDELGGIEFPSGVIEDYKHDIKEFSKRELHYLYKVWDEDIVADSSLFDNVYCSYREASKNKNLVEAKLDEYKKLKRKYNYLNTRLKNLEKEYGISIEEFTSNNESLSKSLELARTNRDSRVEDYFVLKDSIDYVNNPPENATKTYNAYDAADSERSFLVDYYGKLGNHMIHFNEPSTRLRHFSLMREEDGSLVLYENYHDVVYDTDEFSPVDLSSIDDPLFFKELEEHKKAMSGSVFVSVDDKMVKRDPFPDGYDFTYILSENKDVAISRADLEYSNHMREVAMATPLKHADIQYSIAPLKYGVKNSSIALKNIINDARKSGLSSGIFDGVLDYVVPDTPAFRKQHNMTYKYAITPFNRSLDVLKDTITKFDVIPIDSSKSVTAFPAHHNGPWGYDMGSSYRDLYPHERVVSSRNAFTDLPYAVQDTLSAYQSIVNDLPYIHNNFNSINIELVEELYRLSQKLFSAVDELSPSFYNLGHRKNGELGSLKDVTKVENKFAGIYEELSNLYSKLVPDVDSISIRFKTKSGEHYLVDDTYKRVANPNLDAINTISNNIKYVVDNFSNSSPRYLIDKLGGLYNNAFTGNLPRMLRTNIDAIQGISLYIDEFMPGVELNPFKLKYRDFLSRFTTFLDDFAKNSVSIYPRNYDLITIFDEKLKRYYNELFDMYLDITKRTEIDPLTEMLDLPVVNDYLKPLRDFVTSEHGLKQFDDLDALSKEFEQSQRIYKNSYITTHEGDVLGSMLETPNYSPQLIKDVNTAKNGNPFIPTVGSSIVANGAIESRFFKFADEPLYIRESQNAFSQHVVNKISRIKNIDNLVVPFVEDWIKFIGVMRNYASSLNNFDSNYFLRNLIIPSSPVEAYALAQVLYDDFYSKLSIKKQSLINSESDLLCNVPERYRGAVKEEFFDTIKLNDTNSIGALIKKERVSINDVSEEALSILRGDEGSGHDLIYTGHEYYDYTTRLYEINSLESRISLLCNIECNNQLNKSFDVWKTRCDSEFVNQRDVSMASSLNNCTEAYSILNDIKVNRPTLYNSVLLRSAAIQNERRKIFSNQIMSYISKSEDNLLSHLLFHNQLLVIPLKGDELHLKYLNKLVEIRDSNPKYLKFGLDSTNEYMVIGIDGNATICIKNNSKHVDAETIMYIDGDSREFFAPSYEHIGFSDLQPNVLESAFDAHVYAKLQDNLVSSYDQINFFTNSSCKGSLCIPYTKTRHTALLEQLPDGFVSQITKESVALDDMLWNSSQFDFTILGDAEHCYKDGFMNVSDPFISLASSTREAMGSVSTSRMYIYNYFEADSHCRITNVLPSNEYTIAEKLSILKESNDQCVLSLVPDKNSTGFSVKKIDIIDELSVKEAEALNAIIVPYDVYIEMASVINDSTISKTYLKIWAKAMFFMKVAHLCNPGTWLRNWIDGTIKTTGDTRSLGSTASYQLRAMRYLFEYNKIVKEVRNERGLYKGSIKDISNNWSAIQTATKTKMTYEQFKFVEGWLKNSISGGESQILKGIMSYQNNSLYRNINLRRGSTDSLKGIRDLREVKDLVESNIVKFESLDDNELRSLIDEGKRSFSGTAYSYRANEIFDQGLSEVEFWNVLTAKRLGQDVPSDIHSKYANTANNILRIRNKRINKSPKEVASQIDHFCSMMLTPMSKIEQVMRLGEFLALEERGYTKSQIFKTITDTHFNYELKSSRTKAAEFFISYFNFEYNNLVYWCRKLENDPEMLMVLSKLWSGFSWRAAQSYYDNEDVFNNSSIGYMMQHGGLPIDDKGLYLKVNPSAFSALNWFYGMPSQYLTSVVPPIETLSKELLSIMGGQYSEILSNLDYSYADKPLWEKIVDNTPVVGTLYTRYYKHFTETQPWLRVDGSISQRELVKWAPTIFGAVAQYNRRYSEDFDNFQATLAKQGKWYDCNRCKVVPLSQKNTDGLNNPNLSWEQKQYEMFKYKGQLWDANQMYFKDYKRKFGKFTSVGDVWTNLKGSDVLGLNREFDFMGDPNAWDDYCRLKKRIQGVIWDNNQGKFVIPDNFIPGMLNNDNLSWEENCYYHDKLFGTVWDSNQGKFVDKDTYYIPGGLNEWDRLSWDERNKLMLYLFGKVYDFNEHGYVQKYVPLVHSYIPDPDYQNNIQHISKKGDYCFNGNLINDTNTIYRLLNDGTLDSSGLLSSYRRAYYSHYGGRWRNYFSNYIPNLKYANRKSLYFSSKHSHSYDYVTNYFKRLVSGSEYNYNYNYRYSFPRKNNRSVNRNFRKSYYYSYNYPVSFKWAWYKR